MKKKRVFLLCLCVFFPFCRIYADGMFLRPEIDETTQTVTGAYAIEETHQRAFLYHDPTTATERLVIEVRTGLFSGLFAWFIPLPPADPAPLVQFEEIPAEANVFTELDRLTAPEMVLRKHYLGDAQQPRGCMFGCGANAVMELGLKDDASETQQPEVTVWDSGETASFTYSHVSSPTVTMLVDWCLDNGYGAPSSSVQNVLSAYVNREWSFVLIRGAKGKKSAYGNCVSLTFSPITTPYFPLAISAPGHKSRMPVDLFVVSPGYIEPDIGTRDLYAQVYLAPGMGFIETYLIEPGAEIWYDQYIHSFAHFADEADIPTPGEILQGVLSDPYIADDRDYRTGTGSWWRFFSGDFRVYDGDQLTATVLEYLNGLTPPIWMVLSRFQRSFFPGESLEDIRFVPGTGAVPFAGRLYVEVAIYDPEIAMGAGADISLIVGFAIWSVAKTAARRKRRRGNAAAARARHVSCKKSG